MRKLTLDKPMASLSTCHLELVVRDGNLVKSILLNKATTTTTTTTTATTTKVNHLSQFGHQHFH